ncbi:hypothetical protein ATANTOWER_031598, partial [Ataeniobius toweri]|nr:hypothetical protein [Ataeniobius toweri]
GATGRCSHTAAPHQEQSVWRLLKPLGLWLRSLLCSVVAVRYTRSDPRFTCPACPPSNAIHHLEESTHTARLPVNLSLRGLFTSPQNQLNHNEPIPEATES